MPMWADEIRVILQLLFWFLLLVRFSHMFNFMLIIISTYTESYFKMNTLMQFLNLFQAKVD